jgi:uncharacterized membrane protein
MTWLQRYHVRHHVRTSIWILPVLGAVAALGVVWFLHRVDEVIGWKADFNPDTARVDIASKALSPAINDPTTAVLAIDQIHHLLRNVGTRRLDDGQVRDVAGRLRLVYRTPGWEDFVHLAITEIRLCGGESIQVVRRLQAMLENLIQTLPEERASLLRQELSLLHRSAERFFPEPEDRALAAISDLQGVGGTHGHSQRGTEAHSSPNHAIPVSPEETARGASETDTRSGREQGGRANRSAEESGT